MWSMEKKVMSVASARMVCDFTLEDSRRMTMQRDGLKRSNTLRRDHSLTTGKKFSGQLPSLALASFITWWTLLVSSLKCIV